MNREIYLAIFTLLAALFLISFSSAAAQLLCLESGQTIEFSKCNPAILDRTCDSTSCRYCVNEIASGVYCPLSLSSCSASAECNPLDVPDEEEEVAPEIILSSPGSLTILDSAGSVDFQYEVLNSFLVDSCFLNINSEEVATSTERIQSGILSFSYELEEGFYDWKVSCNSRDDESARYDSESRSLTVGNPESNETEQNETSEDTVPNAGFNISLIYPDNSTILNDGQRSVSFAFNISESVDLSNLDICYLILNGNTTNTETNISNSPELNETIEFENILEKNLDVSSYTWSISCLSDSQEHNSESRAITLNNQPSNSGSSGGGGGGGGGSSRSSSSTTSANETNSTITLTEVNTPEESKESSNTTASDPESPAGITGATIGSAISRNRGPIIGFLIVLAALGGFVYYKRK